MHIAPSPLHSCFLAGDCAFCRVSPRVLRFRDSVVLELCLSLELRSILMPERPTKPKHYPETDLEGAARVP